MPKKKASKEEIIKPLSELERAPIDLKSYIVVKDYTLEELILKY